MITVNVYYVFFFRFIWYFHRRREDPFIVINLKKIIRIVKIKTIRRAKRVSLSN